MCMCICVRAQTRAGACPRVCACVRAGGRAGGQAGGRVGEFMVTSCVVACCTLHVVGCMSYRAFCRRGLRAKVARGPGRHATRYNAMQQGTMQQGTIQCNKLQRSATRYNAMEQGTMQCNKQCVPHAQRAGVALHTAHPLRGRPLSARCAALAHAVHVARAGSTLLRLCVLSHVCISLVAFRCRMGCVRRRRRLRRTTRRACSHGRANVRPGRAAVACSRSHVSLRRRAACSASRRCLWPLVLWCDHGRMFRK